MKNIHPEFAYQSRELGIQIEDTLGEPPDRKSYERVIQSLIGEYASGAGIDDVNFFSFALVDHLRFNDPAGLLAQAAQYDEGDADKVLKMVSCVNAEASDALATVANDNPELARRRSSPLSCSKIINAGRMKIIRSTPCKRMKTTVSAMTKMMIK